MDATVKQQNEGEELELSYRLHDDTELDSGLVVDKEEVVCSFLKRPITSCAVYAVTFGAFVAEVHILSVDVRPTKSGVAQVCVAVRPGNEVLTRCTRAHVPRGFIVFDRSLNGRGIDPVACAVSLD